MDVTFVTKERDIARERDEVKRMFVWSSHIAEYGSIPHVVSSTGEMAISLSPLAPENLVSQNGFDRPVAHQPPRSPHSG